MTTGDASAEGNGTKPNPEARSGKTPRNYRLQANTVLDGTADHQWRWLMIG
jgi:hypothetical protein